MPNVPYLTPVGAEMSKVAAEGDNYIRACWDQLIRCLGRDIGNEAGNKIGVIGWSTPSPPPPSDFGGSYYEFKGDVFSTGAELRVRYERPSPQDRTDWIAVPVTPGGLPFRVEVAGRDPVCCPNGFAALAVMRSWGREPPRVVMQATVQAAAQAATRGKK